MTTIITRLYSDRSAAQSVANELLERGHDPDTVDIITREGDGKLADRMQNACVSERAAAVYGKGVESGNALLVVRAPFTPLGTARDALKVVKRSNAIKVDLPSEEYYIRIEGPPEQPMVKILPDHPHFLMNPYRKMRSGHIFGGKMIINTPPRSKLMEGFISARFWPKMLLDRTPKNAILAGAPLMSAKIGMPTVISDWAPRDVVPTKL